MHKILSLTLMGFAVALLTLLSASAPAHAVELRYSIFFPATHGHTILAVEWAKEIEKRTNGAVKIAMFPGGTLTPADQCYDSVVKGISDIGMSVVSYAKGRFPLTEVIDMPLGYKNGAQATRLVNAYYEKFQPKEFADTKIMYMHAHGPGILHSKQPVEKLEDLKGLKVRCTGTSAKVATALGAAPVAMPQGETYEAISKGVAAATLAPMESLKGWKFAEVVKSTTLNYGSAYSIAFFVTMNKKKWESLPKDVQATIERVNKEWIEKTGKAWDDMDKEGAELTLSKGNKLISLSKEEDARWAKLCEPILEEYVKSAGAKGVPAAEALQFCREWLKQNAE